MEGVPGPGWPGYLPLSALKQVPQPQTLGQQAMNQGANFQQFRIVQIIEQHSSHLFTLKELEQRSGVAIANNRELLELLRNNNSILITETLTPGGQIELCFRFKKRFPFSNTNEFLSWLQENKKLPITEDLERESYLGVRFDIEKFQREGKVLYYKVQKKSDDNVIFYNERIVIPLTQELKDLFKYTLDEMPKDIIEIRRILENKKISPSKVDFENKPIVISKLKTKEKKDKKKDKIWHRKENDSLKFELPENFGQFETFQGGVFNQETNSQEDSSETVAVSQEKQTPKELINLIQVVGRLLYNDETVVILDTLAKGGPKKDSKLAEELSLQSEQVRGALFSIERDIFVKSLDVKEGDGTKRRTCLWWIDYSDFVDVVNYRLWKMNHTLTEDIELKEKTVMKCIKPTCNTSYTTEEITRILHSQLCLKCNSPLVDVNLADEISKKQELKADLAKRLQILKPLLTPFSPQPAIPELSEIAASKSAGEGLKRRQTTKTKKPSTSTPVTIPQFLTPNTPKQTSKIEIPLIPSTPPTPQTPLHTPVHTPVSTPIATPQLPTDSLNQRPNFLPSQPPPLLPTTPIATPKVELQRPKVEAPKFPTEVPNLIPESPRLPEPPKTYPEPPKTPVDVPKLIPESPRLPEPPKPQSETPKLLPIKSEVAPTTPPTPRVTIHLPKPTPTTTTHTEAFNGGSKLEPKHDKKLPKQLTAPLVAPTIAKEASMMDAAPLNPEAVANKIKEEKEKVESPVLSTSQTSLKIKLKLPSNKPSTPPPPLAETTTPPPAPVVTIKIEPEILPTFTDDDFDLGPIHFSDNHYLIPLISRATKSRWSITTQKAHRLLCLIGELKAHYSQLFDFQITPLSIYLAQTRGYNYKHLIRILRLLTRNLPKTEVKRLKKMGKGDYFKARIVLRDDGRYWLESALMETASQLAKFAKFAKPLFELSNGMYGFELTPDDCVSVRKFGLTINCPVIDTYKFTDDRFLPDMKIQMKGPETREYQKNASDRLFWSGEAHSGLLILPCGAGKTHVGVNIASKLRKCALILCTSTLAATQWKDQFIKWAHIDPKNISRFTSITKEEWDYNAFVVISTYSMFASTTKKSDKSTKVIENCRKRMWGSLILDEVHLAPADTFRKVTTEIRAHVKFGLTATLIREDNLIEDLPFLVGPKLYEVDLLSLRANHYVATISCTEIKVPMTEEFARAHKFSQSPERRRLLYITNPNKVVVCSKLLERHLAKGQKVLIFCEDLFGLAWFAKVLRRDYIDGTTPLDTREKILDMFRKKKGGDFLLLSKVGDISIDIPEANVLIQVGIVDGSRMQEAQRVGRIQRSVFFTEGWFYSLVSIATSEEEFAKKRRGFMEEHGYRYVDNSFDDHVGNQSQVEDQNLQEDLLHAIDQELTKRDRSGGAQQARVATAKAARDEAGQKRKNVETSRDRLSKKTKNSNPLDQLIK